MAKEPSKRQTGLRTSGVSAGWPQAARVPLEGIRTAVERLQALSSDFREVDEDCSKAKTLAFAAEVVRAAAWAGTAKADMCTPEDVVRRLKAELNVEVTPETVRNWANGGVRHERTGSGRYRVDYDSVLEFLAQRKAA
jgi:uncharacterized protein YpuA (DUF1002 family)